MPFLEIILDFDIILVSFWLKIIKIRVLGQKSLSKNKKKTLPGCWSQSSGVGKHPQMLPFSKLGNWQIQNYFYKIPLNFNDFSYLLAYFPCLGSIAGVMLLIRNDPRCPLASSGLSWASLGPFPGSSGSNFESKTIKHTLSNHCVGKKLC